MLTSLFCLPKLPAIPAGVLVVVTGATSGIGRSVAQFFSDANHAVIGTSRDASAVRDPIPGVTYLSLNLGDPTSIADFANSVLELGTPAVLVNNAGESQSGPLEELPRDALERLFQVNVLGHIELTQKFLPAIRDQGFGRIVMIGSMLGSFPLAYRSSYVASKAAIKGFADACRREVSGFGIGVSTVEPGSIATGLSARRTKYVDANGPYGAEFQRMLTALDNNEAQGISADDVAAEVAKPVFAERPKALYARGSMAPIPFILQRILPKESMLWIINKEHGL